MNNIIENKPVSLEINLDNLAHNFNEIRNSIDKNTKIMAIIKANAYGHGSVQAAKVFVENGADYLGVSTLSEGIELRNGGITTKVLLLNYTPRSNYDKLFEYDLIQTIYNYEDAKVLSEISTKLNKLATIHIKIDTGLTRLGFLPNQESFDQILKISDLENIKIDGVFSHFVRADEEDKTYSRAQFDQFIWSVNILKSMGVEFPIKHMSSSAAVIDLPEYNLDMVRPGIILYGYYPSDEVRRDKLNIIPAMTLKASISNIKTVPSGTGVSYSHVYSTNRDSVIGTLPIGYADGYSREFVGKGEVFLKDRRVPVVGKICMDQMMIDVTDINNVKIGDEVILFGYKDKKYPCIEEMAKFSNTINYEVICRIGRRVPRVYTKMGKVIKIVDYLID